MQGEACVQRHRKSTDKRVEAGQGSGSRPSHNPAVRRSARQEANFRPQRISNAHHPRSVTLLLPNTGDDVYLLDGRVAAAPDSFSIRVRQYRACSALRRAPLLRCGGLRS